MLRILIYITTLCDIYVRSSLLEADIYQIRQIRRLILKIILFWI